MRATQKQNHLIIKRYGESALLLEWKQEISEKVNASVHQMMQHLSSQELLGLESMIPAYCSLLIIFDKSKITFNELQDLIRNLSFDSHENDKSKIEASLAGNVEKSGPNSNEKKWRIPVCYDGEFFLDEKKLSAELRLSREEMIQLHTSGSYRVYMMGFLPGFPYLGKLPERLRSKRLTSPRSKVLAGSIAITDLQTGIYPQNSPGGWNVIGKTPIPLIEESQLGMSLPSAFLFAPGDWVSLYSINKSEYRALTEQVKQGALKLHDLHE